VAVGAALFAFSAVPAAAEDAGIVMPAPFTSAVAMKRQAWRFERLKTAEKPQLTPDLLAAYVERQRKIQSFDGFDVQMSSPTLTEVWTRSKAATSAPSRLSPRRCCSPTPPKATSPPKRR
jgi:hypothetical protein